MSNNDGIIQTLLDRFNTYRLPRILEIKKQVENGETLGDRDIRFFEEMFNDIRQNQHLVDDNEELQKLVAQVIRLNLEITTLALKNEQG